MLNSDPPLHAYPDDDLEWRLIDLTVQLDNARWQIETIQQSLSWRLTAPFRAAHAFAAALLHRPAFEASDQRPSYTPAREDRIRRHPKSFSPVPDSRT